MFVISKHVFPVYSKTLEKKKALQKQYFEISDA